MAESKKQYENKVSVTGELKSLDVIDTKTQKGVPMKIATIKVETGKGSTHTAKMMALEYFEKDGQRNDNQAYKAIQTMENEYVSKEDIAKNVAPEGSVPTVVNINGSLELNMYKNRAGALVESSQINARFVNRINNPEEATFGAEFTIQAYVTSKGVRVEKNDEETDEVKFKAATIDYTGTAHPFELTGNDEYGVATWLEDDSEVGQTLILQGQIINRYIVEQVERSTEGAVGKKIIDTKRDVERKLLVEGIIPIEDEDDKKFITPQEIKDSTKKFQDKKVEIESSTGSKTKEVKKGVQTSKAATTVGKSPKPTIDEDDLPF